MVYTVSIKKTENWYIGWVNEISGVNAQAKTNDQLIVNLKDALKDILEYDGEKITDYELVIL